MTGDAATGRAPASGHWLEQQLAMLQVLVEQHVSTRARAENTSGEGSGSNAAALDQQARQARAALKQALDHTLEQIIARDGITGCMVASDGLVLARAGALPDFDALAAVSQDCFETASRGGQTMALGVVDQLVIVGRDHKLALFRLGSMVLGILSPRSTLLSEALE